MEENAHTRISTGVAGLMVFVAVIFDALQFFLTFFPPVGQILNFFIGVFAALLFFLWFMFMGTGFRMFGKNKARVAIVALGAVVVTLIPFVDALPEITGAVVYMIMQTWAKEGGAEAVATKGTLLARRAQAQTYAARERARRAAEAQRGGGAATEAA